MSRGFAVQGPADDDSLARVLAAGRLVYGCDAEGGGPYAYPDPADPARHVGFEVELIELLCGPLGPRPRLYQGQWDALLSTLSAGHVDLVLNGYELTAERTDEYLATRPYYVFRLQLMTRREESSIRSFDDLTRPKPGGGKWSVAVLGSSSAEAYAREQGGEHVEVIYFNGATDCMMAVRNGQADATLQDEPAALFYEGEYVELALTGPPVGRGYYVMYLRKSDQALRDALDAAIGRAIGDGSLRSLYERYGIWTEAQAEMPALGRPVDEEWSGVDPSRPDRLRGLPLLARYGNVLLLSAGWTVLLACASMPLAMALGLAIALGRLYGPTLLRPFLAAYVELIRGTPLMLQLFVLFFLLPRLGVQLPPLVAGIAGLAINYSAYEAEIYRAGLQAIAPGQMEAALSLGMSRRLALRRVIVPQAVRIVIPPVTNDFIALFKDTSVCSVISIVELTKRYAILANSTGGVLEFAVAAAILYLAMSAPLAWLVRRFERGLSLDGRKGGVV